MEFQWTDELVMEYQNFKPSIFSVLSAIEQFKKSKAKKEYEILSFKADIFVLCKNANGTFGVYEIEEQDLLSSSAHAIHSVKRLSDGEVFSVGDLVKYSDGKCNYEHFIIDNFWINNAGKCLVRGKDNLICEWVTEIQKIRKPLFTTEDGVSVFLDQRVWWVRKSDFELGFHDFYNEKSWCPNRFLYFSTKEAAKDFILMSKPLLSLNEMKLWLERYFNYPDGVNVGGLLELAKSKLTAD